MSFHLFNVSANVNDNLLPNDMHNEIESIYELISVHLFGDEAGMPDNPEGESEGQTIVGVINITWFMNSSDVITPNKSVDLDDLPVDSKLPIARPLFYTAPSFPTDTPPPRVA
ncbi:hypothetical protein EI427_14475 [Flammeovirga pectinis]|uniref:Uncharacterized protein n=1 Tax=Flammeovirga pectinis TaxID=2494373 RepID=A0A3S9P5Q0_9BACT|nr:hypothetical protein [Flammeovirga pectinis]AZQ63392.1 hypothetical protein EI427_14475 [Flammeovirga pectinis]